MPAVDTHRQSGYCARCGRPETDGNHADCAVGLRLEPPRYCTHCDRRMVVQVTPGGWSARCVEHGTLTGTTGAG
jgi:hypothetical protein